MNNFYTLILINKKSGLSNIIPSLKEHNNWDCLDKIKEKIKSFPKITMEQCEILIIDNVNLKQIKLPGII